MKITKRQLQRIIKEERARLNEDESQMRAEAVEEAQDLIYHALRSAEDDIYRRGIHLMPGEFSKILKRMAMRF